MSKHPHEDRRSQKSISQGSLYLVISLCIIALLAYVFPTVVGFDIRAFMKGEAAIAFLRATLGAIIFIYCIRAFALVIRGCTLEGERWQNGLYNALHSTLLGINGLTMLLLAIAGISLMIWGILGIVS